MKTLSLLLVFGINLLYSNSATEPDLTDIKALQVIENRTEDNGIHYHYEIKNTGNTTIRAKSYKVFFKVDGTTVSFDKATSKLEPGQTIKYKSSKIFYKMVNPVLTYSLEIKIKDSDLKNNILKGESKF